MHAENAVFPGLYNKRGIVEGVFSHERIIHPIGPFLGPFSLAQGFRPTHVPRRYVTPGDFAARGGSTLRGFSAKTTLSNELCTSRWPL